MWSLLFQYDSGASWKAIVYAALLGIDGSAFSTALFTYLSGKQVACLPLWLLWHTGLVLGWGC
jgi:hypothetical protein